MGNFGCFRIFHSHKKWSCNFSVPSESGEDFTGNASWARVGVNVPRFEIPTGGQNVGGDRCVVYTFLRLVESGGRGRRVYLIEMCAFTCFPQTSGSKGFLEKMKEAGKGLDATDMIGILPESIRLGWPSVCVPFWLRCIQCHHSCSLFAAAPF